MCRNNKSTMKLSERSRKAARQTTRQTTNKKHAAVEACKLNQPATEEKASKLATEASEAASDPSNRVSSTSGASVADKTPQIHSHSSNNQDEKRLAGARVSVVCKEDNGGHITQFSVSYCQTTSGAGAGLTTISISLTLAAKDILLAQNQETAIKIFTPYKDALHINCNICFIDSTTEQVLATQAFKEVINKSGYHCQQLDANTKLRWMPHHATVEGNRLAEAAARKAATS
ncbi:hypothetical protein N8I77_013731 [Diaporthe amygdali]|uniref:Uncharacterized protein n=1 Tax=Phomopsis amygdali TaxID=1214568 RepID=A0AAD9S0P0_PHOAM|nr:hypothetical protein N8I77_013731 [Diaporthe amygdali]